MGVIADSRQARDLPVTRPMPNFIKRFVSMRLQGHWASTRDAVYTHLDNLEAFFWLTVYVTLQAFRARDDNTLTVDESGLLEEMGQQQSYRTTSIPNVSYKQNWSFFDDVSLLNSTGRQNAIQLL
ncbi:hypothetical protein APHAL10511_008191 [Amanita phalloides]|nr:hypothetical protein APHAL10511_008191 [Amanita phalloides]